MKSNGSRHQASRKSGTRSGRAVGTTRTFMASPHGALEDVAELGGDRLAGLAQVGPAVEPALEFGRVDDAVLGAHALAQVALAPASASRRLVPPQAGAVVRPVQVDQVQPAVRGGVGAPRPVEPG